MNNLNATSLSSPSPDKEHTVSSAQDSESRQRFRPIPTTMDGLCRLYNEGLRLAGDARRGKIQSSPQTTSPASLSTPSAPGSPELSTDNSLALPVVEVPVLQVASPSPQAPTRANKKAQKHLDAQRELLVQYKAGKSHKRGGPKSASTSDRDWEYAYEF